MSLPVNLPELFASRLREMRRPPDGLLHASSDLVGSLRHSQLRAAGAPEVTPTTTDEIVLMTGTLWHDWAHKALVASGLPFMQEVKLGPWMTEGWSGTADWIFFHPEHQAFVLGDMKTIKGDGIPWIDRDGAKQEHIWQLSAYWHALYDMGLPLLEAFGVLYWPKDRGRGDVTPLVQDVAPLPREEVHGRMNDRWAATSEYLARVDEVRPENYTGKLARNYIRKPENEHLIYLNKYLAPVQDRVQKLTWIKQAQEWDLKLEPHWSASFCPFPSELCGCKEQGKTKIGHYDLDGQYHPRKGWEKSVPTVAPTRGEIAKRKRENE